MIDRDLRLFVVLLVFLAGCWAVTFAAYQNSETKLVKVTIELRDLREEYDERRDELLRVKRALIVATEPRRVSVKRR